MDVDAFPYDFEALIRIGSGHMPNQGLWQLALSDSIPPVWVFINFVDDEPPIAVELRVRVLLLYNAGERIRYRNALGVGAEFQVRDDATMVANGRITAITELNAEHVKDRNLERLCRRKLWHEHRERFESILACLTRHDPLHICIQGNPKRETEYMSEVETILPRLSGATSQDEVQKIIHEEFQHWFGASAGPIERYHEIAHELWAICLNGGP